MADGAAPEREPERPGKIVSLVDLLLGFEGLACLRGWPASDQSESHRRLEEIRSICERADQFPSFEVEEVDLETVYAAWAPGYDEFANPLIATEEPVVR